ncbi:MAG: SgcJ/EcaC family oxidoreductase [Alphaproteobacteria bacterium]|nr:MAG: SgcJ/EcaC family oxidoreductase [Alphaproteobacteria bacterium]
MFYYLERDSRFRLGDRGCETPTLGLGEEIVMTGMSETAVEREIRLTIQRLADGWNRQDARLFSLAFTEPHDYVAINGHQMLRQSREDNEDMHRQVWNRLYPEGSRIELNVTGIRALTPDIAVAHATSENEFVAAGEKRSLAGSLTLVLVRSEEGWLIDAFHNGTREARFAGHLDQDG